MIGAAVLFRELWAGLTGEWVSSRPVGPSTAPNSSDILRARPVGATLTCEPAGHPSLRVMLALMPFDRWGQSVIKYVRPTCFRNYASAFTDAYRATHTGRSLIAQVASREQPHVDRAVLDMLVENRQEEADARPWRYPSVGATTSVRPHGRRSIRTSTVSPVQFVAHAEHAEFVGKTRASADRFL